ncbi:hypothetical protein C2S53_019217 [Perilla frutescens var. hirtella]|uniref:O-methyltransferase n=1 Tax=Perilla frutescens var. hirtella TaxID=608512 RepID=A0AAD4JI27_PERFH|nr:hypothetical protein C2S53_019217 [Perilla frutescens var. hirtella]
MASAKGVNGSRKELLDAHAHVSNQIFNFINSMSLKCAIELGIADAIHKHGNPMTLSQLADALHINKAKSDGLHRLMRVLVHSKLFDKAETTTEAAYRLTPASRLLLRDESLNMVPFALTILDPMLVEPWLHVSEWFRDDSVTSFATKHGMPFWELQGVNARLNNLFTAAMACDADFSTTILTNECSHVFRGLKSMVDVGGGNGATAKAITDAFPGLKCTVLDLPHVPTLEGCENLSFVSGDMFEFIPHADAVFLKHILHDWSDEECVKILKKCKAAITPSNGNGGKVIIVEMVLDDNKEQKYEATETQLCFDLQMMMLVTGKERTEREWAHLFYVAGFQKYSISPVLGLRSAIEVFP